MQSAFNNRSVFLTGHTGFKGSWLALWLARLGARVHGFALAPPTQPSNYEVSGVRKVLAGETLADIRDAAAMTAALERARPDYVFHLAAQALVRESYATPRETFDVNVQGTASLLDAVRVSGRPCTVVIVTSDKCYENHEQTWGYRECDPVGGFDPYSASKGACEILVNSYRRSFFHPDRLDRHGVKLASARAGNVIGGGDWACDRIVSDIVQALAVGQPVPVRNKQAIRPWQHVLEPLSGYLALAARMAASDDPVWCAAWNFGPAAGGEATVLTLVESFIKHWGAGTWDDRSDPSAPHEAGVLRLSIDKATSLLHWHPRWSFDETVRRTAHWYRQFYAGASPSMLKACEEDLDAYERAKP